MRESRRSGERKAAPRFHERSATATAEGAETEQTEQAEGQAIAAGGRRGRRAANAAAFEDDATGLAGMRCRLAGTTGSDAIAIVGAFDTLIGQLVAYAAAHAAIVVGGAFYAFAGGLVADEATHAIGVRFAARHWRHDARMRIGIRVAHLRHGTIGIFVAHALVHRVVAVATAAFGVIGARLVDFLRAIRSASIARRSVAVVAAFIHFEDIIATTGGHAKVRIGNGIADVAAGAIGVPIASAFVVRRIAESTFAAVGRRIAGLSQLEQACRAAIIAWRHVAVVASLAHFNDRIAAPRIDTCMGRRRCVADLAARAIGIVVAGAGPIGGITESAGACRPKLAALANFTQTGVVAAIIRGRIAIVAALTHFEDAIATTRIDAFIRARENAAQLHARAIRIVVTSAHGPDGIAETRGAGRRATRTSLPDLELARAAAAVAIHHVVVVAGFADFEDAIATTSKDADVRIGREFANWRPRRTIGIFVANARCIDRITRAARTC